MENAHEVSPDPSSDAAHRLPRDVYLEIMRILRVALPFPRTGEGTEPDLARRNRAAMAAVAGLRPQSPAEGRLAAQFVAADAWAMDCLRQAEEKWREPRLADKCRAQAMGMMREGKSAMRVLLRVQAARREVEKDEAEAGRAAWAEHCALAMMEAGLPEAADLAEAVSMPPGGDAGEDVRVGRVDAGAAGDGGRAGSVARPGGRETWGSEVGDWEVGDDLVGGLGDAGPLTLPSPPIAGGERKDFGGSGILAGPAGVEPIPGDGIESQKTRCEMSARFLGTAAAAYLPICP